MSTQTHMPYFRPSVWGGAAHLWGQTGSRSRECGSRGRRHAGTQREREPSQLGSFPISLLSPPNITTHSFPAHLSMTPRSQGLPAALAPQTGSVPISAQRHHLLSWGWREVVALGTGHGDPPAWHHLPALGWPSCTPFPQLSLITYQNRQVPHSRGTARSPQ